MDAKIRKLENNLVTVGSGVVIFSLWSLLRMIVYFIVLGDTLLVNLTPLEILFAMTFIWGVIIIDCVIRCFIGLSARSEGYGNKKRLVYVVLACIVFVNYTLLFAMEIVFIVLDSFDLVTLVVTIVIDLTSNLFVLDMIVSSIRLRRLRKQIAAEKEGAV